MLVFPAATDPNNSNFAFPESVGSTFTLIEDGTNYGRSQFSSFVDVGNVISFESSNVTSGIGIRTTSRSLVSFDFTNTTGSDVDFISTIIPAGFGFYLANVDSCVTFSSCRQVTGLGADLAFLKPSVTSLPSISTQTVIGLASFDFRIKDQNTELYRVSGTLRLTYDSVLDRAFVVPSPFTPSGGSLNGFIRSTAGSDPSAVGYAWDSTDVSFALGQGMHRLSYSTAVHSWSLANPLACGASLVAFSGFGDPVGRGGGVEEFSFSSASSEGSSGSASSFGSQDCVSNGDIEGVNFTRASYRAPVLDGGVLTYSAAVPEPATWALMIGGFGLAGVALRRRSRVAYT